MELKVNSLMSFVTSLFFRGGIFRRFVKNIKFGGCFRLHSAIS